MTARLFAGALALSLSLIAPLARAQDEAAPVAQPVVVTIAGPCVMALEGQDRACAGVAYMAFPATHRIDFTVIGAGVTWAFSGEQDDNDKGQYSLTVDSIVSPESGRMDADGECDMDVADDGRTVRSIACQAKTAGGTLTLKASGVIASSSGGDDGDDDDDGGDGAKG